MKKFHFTYPEVSDLEALMFIEQSSFTEEEAASEKAMLERLQLIPDTFIVAKDIKNQVCGFVVGPAIHARYITDDLFEESRPNPIEAPYIAILSLAVHPKYRGQGVGQSLLTVLNKIAIKQKRTAITLTCLEKLIPFYEKSGYTNEGVSSSNHAGEIWYNMVSTLKKSI